MSLLMKQDSHYVGRNQWEWSVWLEGPAEELDQVDHMFYNLGTGFNRPVREVYDRETNFRLSTFAWDPTVLYAKAIFKDGHEQHFEHQVEFVDPTAVTRV